MIKGTPTNKQKKITQSAGAAEYIDCGRVRHLPNEWLEYDTKQSDGENPSLELWGMWSSLGKELNSNQLYSA